MQQFTLYSPLDMHVHFRQGAMMNKVVPLTAQYFAGGLVMPNTNPPITNAEELKKYREEILEVVSNGMCAKQVGANAAWCEGFDPYMTLYLQPNMTADDLWDCHPYLKAVKLYPKGMTTNSDHGVDTEDPNLYKVFEALQEMNIPLCVHGETKGYIMDRELRFLPTYQKWADDFPELRIVMEHITTAAAVRLLTYTNNLYATVTAHHLLITTDDLMGDLLNPHLFCKPVAKRPEDRSSLVNLVLGRPPYTPETLVYHKVMLGTDSAPHPIDKKECACGCMGSSPDPSPCNCCVSYSSGRGRPIRTNATRCCSGSSPTMPSASTTSAHPRRS